MQKRLILAVVVSAFASGVAMAQAKGTEMIVSLKEAKTLVVRAKPDPEAVAISHVDNGRNVVRLPQEASNGFVAIRLPDGRTGWVKSAFLVPITGSVVPEQPSILVPPGPAHGAAQITAQPQAAQPQPGAPAQAQPLPAATVKPVAPPAAPQPVATAKPQLPQPQLQAAAGPVAPPIQKLPQLPTAATQEQAPPLPHVPQPQPASPERELQPVKPQPQPPVEKAAQPAPKSNETQEQNMNLYLWLAGIGGFLIGALAGGKAGMLYASKALREKFLVIHKNDPRW